MVEKTLNLAAISGGSMRDSRAPSIANSFAYANTWLPRSELGNAQGLLEKFEAKGRAKNKLKRGRPA